MRLKKAQWVFIITLITLVFLWCGAMVYVRYARLHHEVFDVAGTKADTLSQTLDRVHVRDVTGARVELVKMGQFNKDKPVIVYFYGRSGRTPILMHQAAKLAPVISPSYRGYYGSEGTPSKEALRDAAEAAIEYLLAQGYNQQDIIILGHSLGGAAALHAAAQYPQLQKVVIVNSFYSTYTMCAKDYYLLCGLVGDYSGSVATAPEARGKVRVFYTDKDVYVPQMESETLFEAIGARDKRLIMIPGGHADFNVEEVLRND